MARSWPRSSATSSSPPSTTPDSVNVTFGYFAVNSARSVGVARERSATPPRSVGPVPIVTLPLG